MHPLRHRRAYFLCGILYTALVIWLTLTSSPPSGPDVPFADKGEHFAAYGLMMAWWGQLFRAPRRRWQVACACMALGALLELLQGLGGVRQMELADALANATGVLLGLAATQGAGGRLLARFEGQA